MGWFKAFVLRHVVDRIPSELEGCGTCNEPACSERNFRSCPIRRRYAERKAKAEAGETSPTPPPDVKPRVVVSGD